MDPIAERGDVRGQAWRVAPPPTADRRDGSDPESVTELIIEGGTAGPLSFTYGPDGLSVAQQGVPSPSGDALVALNEALAPAGLSIGVLRAQEVAGGQASEVLVVEQAGDTANGSRNRPPGSGTST